VTRLCAWDRSPAQYWAAIDAVRRHEDTEGDLAVLCDALAAATARPLLPALCEAAAGCFAVILVLLAALVFS